MKHFFLTVAVISMSLTSVKIAAASEKPKIVVGSKIFAESYILAEIFSRLIEEAGEAEAVRKFGLGQTGIAFEALSNGRVDLYPEYTGTISETILKNHSFTSVRQIRSALQKSGLNISESLGFKDTYALAVKREIADRLHIKKISDLRKHADIKAGLSHEFLERNDGYPSLKKKYGFHFTDVHGMAHGLSYEALNRGEIELTDVYSTDAMVKKLDLVLLDDDLSIFPDYSAVIFARDEIRKKFPKTWAKLISLQGKIDKTEMTNLNALVELDKKSFSEAANVFFRKEHQTTEETLWSKLWKLTKQHLALVGLSLLASTIVGVPLGIVAKESRALRQIILISSGVIQTIPSLALLCFLIPLFGIGNAPALFALFLYGLLPIVRGTYIGLNGVDARLFEVSRALGLTYKQRLLWIEIPMASPSILSGIRTSAIINVGTTTLAALIGAGGYGVPIVTGLALNDLPTILQGAIPSAIMALGVHGAFDILEKFVLPKGIR